jgi:UDP-N-acetylmuramate dehydrogenase
MFPSQVPHRLNEPLSMHTSYRIGGPAKIFALPRTQQDIFLIGSFLLEKKMPYFILGNGSNLLAPDDGFSGVVICTKELEPFLEFHENKVRVSASTLNSRLLRACADMGLGGIEYLSGVPGNVGGAVFMNAGTAQGWIDSSLESVEAVSLRGGVRKIPKEALKYSYREQHFLQSGEIIWAANLNLVPQEKEKLKEQLVESIKKRKAAQPIELPSCGSVFRNPEGKNAWKLIADAGLRGFQKGGARFSEKHCNFIVNEGGAKKADVEYLIQLAREKVRVNSNIELHPEVILMEPKFL